MSQACLGDPPAIMMPPHAHSAPKVLEPQSDMLCSPTATVEHSADYSMPRATDLGPYSERSTRLAEGEHGG